ncbi:Pex18p NDAI_0C03270 [Naumovozyma dairenensis CBS 421]|uniref:PEX18/PEX21 C-terminal domain-containing protein n=1 Tax=Naumovozyma dairenensis (strain ATCC 10597 / BCRC 20456 / CBS 421 / NBRC 0211 / NRRL Y-12639) TaxID=1071378 RepID=G0W876_NAUDC|nr:hypothetical protein NDAI_0C03270 [Naumovozyma dairenensis CBS 421]CCD23987.1 hypothetical protein NDAI_0C03270 [Naumovozyma dairenensis CBS 421]
MSSSACQTNLVSKFISKHDNNLQNSVSPLSPSYTGRSKVPKFNDNVADKKLNSFLLNSNTNNFIRNGFPEQLPHHTKPSYFHELHDSQESKGRCLDDAPEWISEFSNLELRKKDEQNSGRFIPSKEDTPISHIDIPNLQGNIGNNIIRLNHGSFPLNHTFPFKNYSLSTYEVQKYRSYNENENEAPEFLNEQFNIIEEEEQKEDSMNTGFPNKNISTEQEEFKNIAKDIYDFVENKENKNVSDKIRGSKFMSMISLVNDGDVTINVQERELFSLKDGDTLGNKFQHIDSDRLN